MIFLSDRPHNVSGNRVAAKRLGFQKTLGRRLRLTALLYGYG